MKKSYPQSMRSPKIRNMLGGIPKSITSGNIIVVLLMVILIVCCLVFVPYPYGNGDTILRHLLH